MARICAVGDNTVDQFLDWSLACPGGQAFNVAIAARRAGADSAYLGVLGGDEAGDMLAEVLRIEQVDSSRLRRSAEPNSRSVVTHDDDGDRVFGPSVTTLNRFTLSTDDHEYLSRYDVVHVTDASHQETELEEIAVNASVSFDFSTRSVEFAELLLPFVRFAFFSGAGRDLAECTKLARWALEAGAHDVVVTRGREGALAVSRSDELVVARAVDVTVIDTLGAGDAFAGEFLAARTDAAPMPIALARASFAAARACAWLGGTGYVRQLATM
jgi:fructoselysine 6-kinase